MAVIAQVIWFSVQLHTNMRLIGPFLRKKYLKKKCTKVVYSIKLDFSLFFLFLKKKTRLY